MAQSRDEASTPITSPHPHTHRFLQVLPGQLAVLSVVIEDGAELQMSAGLDALRRLELEDGLQAVHTQPDLGRAGRSEMFGETQ